jgi:hypothetical protein
METYYQTFGTDLFLEDREDGETTYGLDSLICSLVWGLRRRNIKSMLIHGSPLLLYLPLYSPNSQSTLIRCALSPVPPSPRLCATKGGFTNTVANPTANE